MQPEQPSRKTGTSLDSLQQGCHDRVIAAAVTCDYQPGTLASFDQYLTELRVLMAKLGRRVLQAAEAKVAVKLHLSRPPLACNRLAREVRRLKTNGGKCGGCSEYLGASI